MVVGMVVLVVLLMRRSPAKLTAPTAFETYNAPEGEFSVQYPADWNWQDGGIKNQRTFVAKKGSAKIEIRQSLAGSLMGDIAGAGSDPNAPDDRQPVARVHEFKKAGWAEEIGGKYEEQPATTISTKGLGKARRSAFTSSSMFQKKRGYRATVLATMISYDVICMCSEEDWPMMEPAFTKVIQSLGQGR